MSYAAISTTHHIGEKKLPGLSGEIRFLSGLRGMGALGGDISQADLEDAGVDPGIATGLLAAGATDAQLGAVIANPDSQDAAIALLGQMNANLDAIMGVGTSGPSGVLPPSSPAALSPGPTAAPALTQQAAAETAASASYLPAGAQLGYTLEGGSLSISEAIITWTWTSVVAQLNAYLQQRSGIIITGSNASGNPLSSATGFSATVQLLQPYTNALMVKQVIDQALAGIGVTGTSNISVINAGAVAAGAPPPAGAPGGAATPQTLTDWFTSNWYWVAAAVGLIVVIPPIVKKL